MSRRRPSGRGLVCLGASALVISAEELLRQGNAICMAGNERLDAVGADLPQDRPPTAAELEPLFDTVTQDIQGQIDDLGALAPPEELESEVESFLADAQGVLDEVEERGAEGLFSAEDNNPFADVNAQADEIGLTECADDEEE